MTPIELTSPEQLAELIRHRNRILRQLKLLKRLKVPLFSLAPIYAQLALVEARIEAASARMMIFPLGPVAEA